jgi:ParB-like nuclease family protein
VHDFEMTPPLQPAAAVRPEPPYTDPEEDDEEPPAARPARARSREGLPSAYRMRHAPHYVEQLMGDTPLQTVRQISIDQIDGTRSPDDADGSVDLSHLAASIGEVGVLQPLLVIQGKDTRFALLAGAKRLAAAHAAGLQAVPCLVVHADEARAAELRTQAAVVSTVRAPDPLPAPSAPELPLPPTGSAGSAMTAAMDEVAGALDFVTALMPAASAARSPFQQSIIADIIEVEKRRAAVLSAAASFLSDATPLQPEEFDWLAFTEELRADAALEARLRAVEIEWLHSLKLRPAVADRKAVMQAWTAILHASLGASVAGDRMTIALATPRVRPAIILTVSLRSTSRFTPSEADQASATAFAGGAGELMLGSARHSARRQGGRVSVTATADALTIEFALPQPLAYWQ